MDSPALTDHEITGPALATEDTFHATCLTASTAPTIHALAELHPRTLGLMHGPSYVGDCEQSLHDLGSAYEERFTAEGPACTVRCCRTRDPAAASVVEGHRKLLFLGAR